MAAPSARPAEAPPIVVRRPRLALDPPPRAAGGEDPMPRYWWGGDPFRTHFLNALSSTFPFGEAFFVRSVNHYAGRIEAGRIEADRIGDEALRERIRAFAGQEGQHSRLHDEHVAILDRQGYTALERRNRFFDRIVRWHNRRTPRFALAMTAAIEHLTAILARQLLGRRASLADDMEPRMRALWRWHALEEAEHKAVAFDVMDAVEVPRWLRVWAMAIATFDLVNEVTTRVAYMLWKDGRLFEGRTWRGGLRFLFGEGGFLRGAGADYAAWYRRGFHPDDVDDRALIEANTPAITAAISA